MSSSKMASASTPAKRQSPGATLMFSRPPGKNRLRVIAEAFRPQVGGGGFRSATLEELRPQLAAYGDHRLFLFEGPHYVTDALVRGLSSP
ncbi:MAG: hypothetical protein QOJ15_6214 [Bradyrhizobium sp.]|jgi:hypothetical protein|nr:hypothetical protein [Bradyrhizobium sp.]